jgi:hypothetical protein
LLSRKEQVVHLPEGIWPTLRPGGLGRFGGDQGLVMNGDEGELAIDEPYLAFISV